MAKMERVGLSFLFKVLSIRTALSIQAHPDKRLAGQLHAENPNAYKDDNHKPEMTLALTDFEALSCFVSHEELRDAIVGVPELAECVGKEESEALAADLLRPEARQGALKSAFRAVMTRDAEVVKGLIGRLVRRLQSSTDLTEKERLILRLDSQYPGDVGIFAAYFLNYIKIKPGQAIYLEANEPHAYLSGNCVEVMATSVLIAAEAPLESDSCFPARIARHGMKCATPMPIADSICSAEAPPMAPQTAADAMAP